MIDMLRDYTAIGVGTLQATTARIAGLGRGTANLITRGPDAGLALGLLHPRAQVALASDVGRQLVAGDVEAVINRIGLVKRSELQAVRSQLQRLERRVAEGRSER